MDAKNDGCSMVTPELLKELFEKNDKAGPDEFYILAWQVPPEHPLAQLTYPMMRPIGYKELHEESETKDKLDRLEKDPDVR